MLKFQKIQNKVIRFSTTLDRPRLLIITLLNQNNFKFWFKLYCLYIDKCSLLQFTLKRNFTNSKQYKQKSLFCLQTYLAEITEKSTSSARVLSHKLINIHTHWTKSYQMAKINQKSMQGVIIEIKTQEL